MKRRFREALLLSSLVKLRNPYRYYFVAGKNAANDKFIQQIPTRPTKVLTNPKGQYLRALLLRKSEKLRTPYYVPSNPDVDAAILRKPTRPMKVLTGPVRLDRRREFVPRRSVARAIPKVEDDPPDDEDLVMPSGSQMNVVLKKPKEEFLVNQLMADTKNHRMTTRSKSGVQQKRPRETSSQEKAEAVPRKKPRAPTKKAISRSAKKEVPAPASKHADDPPLNSPIQFTFRISDSPVEYAVVINSS